jgi:hypothetical protein
MNHVQNLHSQEVQNLHALEMQNLPAGPPECKICRLARMQKMPAGQNEIFAYGPKCKLFYQAYMQKLHSGPRSVIILPKRFSKILGA